MANNTFPSSQLFHYPILLLLADQKVHTRKEMMTFEIEKLSISDSDLKVTTPGRNGNKGKNKVVSWISYAISDLKKAEYIEHIDNGYKITTSGLAFFNNHKEGFMGKELSDSAAYRNYKNIDDNGRYRNNTKKDKENEAKAKKTIEGEEKEPPSKTPIEILEELSTHINETLETTMLEALKKMSPESFECLIKELLLKMEIGKTNECIEQTPYVKDDGVDIYVYDNALKMNVICCIQVKRYSETAVGLSTVKELGGTLLDKNCKSGMVITTSQFTKGATDYNPSGYNIQKIDGIQLTKLLISYGLGIKTKRIEVKTVDLDYLQNL